MSWTTTTTTH